MTQAPCVLAVLVLTGTVYGLGAARLRRRPCRTVAFSTGLGVLAAALLPPLDALASKSFSAHMVQHLVLVLVAAPVLAIARPAAPLLAGLPARARSLAHRAGTLRRRPGPFARAVAVWTVGTLVLWAWHMPSLYELALSHDVLHAAEHAGFLGGALLFWAVVLHSGARRGIGRPVALLLVLATAVQSAALGAAIALASAPLYPSARDVEDQQLAGALMWGPPTLLYVVAMAWLLVRWFAEMEHSDPLPMTAEPVR